ncbi:rSAM-associated Gly-rich repeat protein [Synechococcus sp. BSF8S]|uniref:GrrA/OscA1 family cyclophane-containing rSAM-modified RiPP n=1 Tax=Synechococcales TaxID=1890424 RepID=UPI00162842AF|nr:rSAM-associated Gly-rich repeat protein [Synechococcus sp. BSF8S]MBC1265179.1 rSAM-associated Gly-rich repeat protein [Synechococcus sp. BSA11S]
MEINTRSAMLAWILALAALCPVPAIGAVLADSGLSESDRVDRRLSRISEALRAQQASLRDDVMPVIDERLAFGWADGKGNRGWVNTRYGGAARGSRGSWGNARRYYGGPRRAFANGGGGFYNGGSRGRTFVNW